MYARSSSLNTKTAQTTIIRFLRIWPKDGTTHEILIHRLETSQSRSDIQQHGPPHGSRVVQDESMSYPRAPIMGYQVEAF